MNVLVITPVYPHQADLAEGLFVEEQSRALVRSGAKVRIVVCKPWIPSQLANVWKLYRPLANLPQMEEKDGIPIHYARYLHIPHFWWVRYTIASCARSILKALKKCNPREQFDVIQVHDCWPIGLAAPRIARILGSPFVLTMHILDEEDLYRQKEGKALYEAMMREASKVIAVGNPLQRFAQNWMPEPQLKHLHLIPNGVNATDTLNNQVCFQTEGNGWGRIISVCNLWPSKGIDLNLKALRKLDEMGVPWLSYTVVGDGPEWSKLNRLAKELGIAHKVHFMGKLGHSEVMKAVAKADLFSLPSWREAFGIAYLEAMVCGKAAIGCKGQGAEDIIQHEKTGLLVQPNNVDDLTVALKRLLKNPEFAQRLGKAGLLRAQDFNWDRTARQYLDLYTEICAPEAVRKLS
jgi:glycosyltransferase involved in cell wall biosynthesis